MAQKNTRQKRIRGGMVVAGRGNIGYDKEVTRTRIAKAVKDFHFCSPFRVEQGFPVT
jgi:hypothetical protein